MKILCLTPVKHLSGVHEYLSSFGEVEYAPECIREDFNHFDMNKFDVIFCNPNKQKYILNKEMLQHFSGTIVTASTGLNHIDVKYCEQNNIKVLSLTKDYDLINDLPSTAELAFGLMLSIVRNIPNSFNDVKKGGWDYDMFMGHQLKDRTIGIIGYGRLGTMMEQYCKAFGMNIIIHDPYKGYDNLHQLIHESDIISLHVHVTDETRKMIDKNFLDLMKKDSYIINTSRGEIVNEKDIIQSLQSGNLKGYATDVIEDEYYDRDKSPILNGASGGLNIIVTPHIGGMTWEGQQKAYKWSINKLGEIK